MTKNESELAKKYIDQIIATQEKLGSSKVPATVRRNMADDVQYAARRFSALTKKRAGKTE